MKRKPLFLRGAALFMVVMVLFGGVTSCGTLLYPDRIGQSGGMIDARVVILDGIGLLLFIIPGVVAFAVDFAMGTIYLPSYSTQLDISPLDFKHAKAIQTESEHLTRFEIETLIKKETQQEINLASSQTRVARVLPGHPVVWGGITEILTPNQLFAFEYN